MKGEVNPYGMVVNAADLKKWMEKAIMSQFDHRNIVRMSIIETI
jgi:6-pyruvoyl-tetrahydropterin synthase